MGATKWLPQRLSYHRYSKVFDCVEVIPVHYHEMKQLEDRLIKIYRPKYNVYQKRLRVISCPLPRFFLLGEDLSATHT